MFSRIFTEALFWHATGSFQKSIRIIDVMLLYLAKYMLKAAMTGSAADQLVSIPRLP